MIRDGATIVETHDPRQKSFIWFGENYPVALKTSFSVGFVYGYLHRPSIHIIPIDRLQRYELQSSLTVLLEKDEEGFIARVPDLPLYGYGDDSLEAINMLKAEIETLYIDLMEDDNFSEDWLKIKNYLMRLIKNN